MCEMWAETLGTWFNCSSIGRYIGQLLDHLRIPYLSPQLFLGIKLWKCSRKHYNECYRSVHFAHQIMKNVIDRFQLDYLHLTTEPLATDVLDDGLSDRLSVLSMQSEPMSIREDSPSTTDAILAVAESNKFLSKCIQKWSPLCQFQLDFKSRRQQLEEHTRARRRPSNGCDGRNSNRNARIVKKYVIFQPNNPSLIHFYRIF